MVPDSLELLQSCLFTLPMNLCIQPSKNPAGGYGIWSLIDIPCKTVFGPYKGLLIDGTEEEMKGGYQWKVEQEENRIKILDGSNQNTTSWLRYINYALNKDKQNLIAVQHNSEVYYVTTKMISANTELFVWYKDSSIYKRKIRIESHDIKIQDQCSTSQGHENVYTSGKKNTKNTTLRKHRINRNAKHCFECNTCGKKLRAHLKRHEMIHTGERPFKCTVCGKKFIERGGLTAHKRTHSGEKPHQCDVCGEQFVRKNVLIIHQRVHSGEKPYECSTCGRRFRHKCAMVAHERGHTGEKPYTCEVCGKKFKVKSPMIVHQRIHTGEKPFTCKICRKKFTHLTTLAEHEMVHTGNKPFQCSSCGKKFGNRYKLTTHERIHAASEKQEVQETF